MKNQETALKIYHTNLGVLSSYKLFIKWMEAFNLDNPMMDNLKIHSDLFWTFFVVTIKVASVCCFGEYLQTKQGNYTGKASLWRDRKAVWFPFYPLLNSFLGFPDSSVGKESACNAGPWFDSWVRKIPCRRDWLPTLVFWPREFHMDCIVHGVAKSWTQLSDFHINSLLLRKKQFISPTNARFVLVTKCQYFRSRGWIWSFKA